MLLIFNTHDQKKIRKTLCQNHNLFLENSPNFDASLTAQICTVPTVQCGRKVLTLLLRQINCF